jgi:hypothetical protein
MRSFQAQANCLPSTKNRKLGGSSVVAGQRQDDSADVVLGGYHVMLRRALALGGRL